MTEAGEEDDSDGEHGGREGGGGQGERCRDESARSKKWRRDEAVTSALS